MRPFFLSYRRQPWMPEVLQLSTELRQRGIQTRMDVSDPEQIAGSPQYDALRRMIIDECDGFILYLTENVGESACITKVEIPAAFTAFDRGEFTFVPIFRGLSPRDVQQLEFQGRRIAALGGVVVPHKGNSAEVRAALVEAANTVLGAAVERHRQRAPGEHLVVGARTRDIGPEPGTVDLLLDWAENYGRVLAGGASAGAHLRVALEDVACAAARSGARKIRVVGPSHLSAGLAIGYVFRRPSGFRLEAQYEGSWWSAEGDEEPADLQITPTQLDPAAPDCVLTLAFARPEVIVDADMAVIALGLPVGGRILVQPLAGPGRAAVRSGAHARAIVRAVTDALMRARADWAISGRTHIFIAAPLPLAVLLGHALNAFGPLRVYERTIDNQAYVSTFDL